MCVGGGGTEARKRVVMIGYGDQIPIDARITETPFDERAFGRLDTEQQINKRATHAETMCVYAGRDPAAWPFGRERSFLA